jgi:methylmalonyl-CoA mutase N-terminal domain/subunit
MREDLGADNPECWRMRFSVQTAGNTLTTKQPHVNIMRANIEAMAGVFGGAQSIHLCSYDEGHGLPTEESSRIALRTQQVIAYESGITKTIDPLGGSYYVESLTNRVESEIQEKLTEIDNVGGMVQAIKEGWLETQINTARYRNQDDLDTGKRTLIGVNKYTIPAAEETPVKVHKIQADYWGENRKDYLRKYRAERDPQKWNDAMTHIEQAWRENENMVPVIMNALKNKATMGEIHEAMRQAQDWSFR